MTDLSLSIPLEYFMKEPTKFEILDREQRLREDFTSYLASELVVSLEMELDFKRGAGWRDSMAYDLLGTNGDSYSDGCPICGNWTCAHDPPKTIREVKVDCTINGREMVVWGSKMSSEEFARRLPLKDIKKYFHPTPSDSMHTHTLISRGLTLNPKPFPIIIARNAWQLFRAYYPAWVYVFGNYKGRFLRSKWAKWTPYDVSATDWPNWISYSRNYRQGLYYGNIDMDSDSSTLQSFDAEIRTQDASVELDQIVAARAMSKAIFLRASELSKVGLIELPRQLHEEVAPMIMELNNAAMYGDDTRDVEALYGPFMRDQAIELYTQLKDFLSKFESECVRSCIESPVRNRRRHTTDSTNELEEQ